MRTGELIALAPVALGCPMDAAGLRRNTLVGPCHAAESPVNALARPVERVSGTGFSREGVEWHTAELRLVTPASSRLKPVPLEDRVTLQIAHERHSGTGFSREDVGCHATNLMMFMQASSRLKPVPLIDRMHSVRLGSSQLQTACSQRGWR